MTAITPAPVQNEQTARRHGKCQWLTANAAESMRGVGATLEITSETKAGPVTRAYFVSNVIQNARLVGWQLTQPASQDDGSIVQYEIDASFDLRDASQWECSCKDYAWASKRRKTHACKHVRGVAHSLVHVGLLPVETTANLS